MSLLRYMEATPQPTDFGTIRREQTTMLMGLAASQRGVGTHVLEFGTLYGTSATNLARMMPDHRVLTVSLPEGVTPTLRHHPTEFDHYPKKPPIFADDVTWRISHYACDSALLDLSPTLKLGLVFVDGGHTYEYVMNDFGKAEPLMVSKAVVVFDDYGTDCKDGITEVKKAVDEIMAARPTWEWTEWVGCGLVWGRKP